LSAWQLSKKTVSSWFYNTEFNRNQKSTGQ